MEQEDKKPESSKSSASLWLAAIFFAVMIEGAGISSAIHKLTEAVDRQTEAHLKSANLATCIELWKSHANGKVCDPTKYDLGEDAP